LPAGLGSSLNLPAGRVPADSEKRLCAATAATLGKPEDVSMGRGAPGGRRLADLGRALSPPRLPNPRECDGAVRPGHSGEGLGGSRRVAAGLLHRCDGHTASSSSLPRSWS
ncbi:hypothetical protein EI555_002801, partial [Monodon monoceros]